MLIFLLTALFPFIVFSPYIAGLLVQTPGMTFTGVVHYPLDYYYYLSYMAQGKTRWLTAFYINTTEAKTPIFYHWFYVLSGRIFSTLGISNSIGYQLLILGLSVLLCVVSYRLICEVIPSRAGRTIAYILFLTSNAWPYLSHTSNGWALQPYWFWYNYGEPFIRFSSIPHHLLAQSVLVVILLLLVRVPRIPQSRYLCTWSLFFVSGFLLASTQTPQVPVVLLVCGIFWVKDIIVSRKSDMFPALILLLAGAVPYALYLRLLFQNQPFTMIAAWEATQQVRITLLQFFRMNGPVMLLGVIGLPLFLSKRLRAREIIAVCTLVSWGIFLSPVPIYISVLNVRFLSVVPTLVMACSSAVLIEAIATRFGSRLQVPVRMGITVILLALTIPATAAQVISRTIFNPGNAYIFLPNEVLAAYVQVEKYISPQETCLVIWPFHESFTGLTGRRAYTVNEYATVGYTAKETQANAFFAGQMNHDQQMKFFTSNNISCVVTYSFTKNVPAALIPAYTNSYMTVYKVTKE